MKNYIKHDPWKIIEEGFDNSLNKNSESVCSIGNGKGGQRANFEETFTGNTLQGSYVSGVYYPDKTRVGWWKNGYPEYFAKMLNAPSWIGIHINIEGEELDLAKCKVDEFSRVLDMKRGVLERHFVATMQSGKRLEVNSTRFLSIVRDEIGAIKYCVKPLNFSAKATVISDVDADIVNQDSNYDEKFWVEISKHADDSVSVTAETKKTKFQVCTAAVTRFSVDTNNDEPILREKYAGKRFSLILNENETVVINKYACITSTMYYTPDEIEAKTDAVLYEAVSAGFETLLAEQERAWDLKWQESDIIIDGDVAAQQGIRFNIFQLNQTYTGRDERLNIGPKGFTGEKYGGTTYWDTEAYCLPFYLATADKKVAHSLLVYRWKHLAKAIENAEKLGFTGGAALYPMVTINGEECHNEWEITFEEIHRNGAIAHAIYDYVTYTGDKAYLVEYGLEVLIGISRFWAQRVILSPIKRKYMILGVTGPNEYENNVNNNWYTNYFAQWCLRYTLETISWVKRVAMEQYQEMAKRISFEEMEVLRWSDIVQNMYLPTDEKYGIILQQDGYLDKEAVTVADLPADQRPINQHWSWDRILRSPYIKQADVVQGLYFFESDFEMDTIRRNFDFYEARCVHESSLSPCIHSVVASKIGNGEKAYELYLRTARLDLDDYNKEAQDGLHITSMSGSWLAIVKGFAGMRVQPNYISFEPYIPKSWKAYSFTILYRNAVMTVKVGKSSVEIRVSKGFVPNLKVYGETYEVKSGETLKVKIKA